MSENQKDKTLFHDSETIEEGAGDIPDATKHPVGSTGKTSQAEHRPTTAHGSRTPSNLTSLNAGNQSTTSKQSNNDSRSDRKSSHFKTGKDIPSTSRDGHSSGKFSKQESSTFVNRVREEERQVGEQGRILMDLFIQERAQNTPYEVKIREVCQADVEDAHRLGFSDDSLNDIAFTLRSIGDEISQNVELNNIIDSVPADSTKEIFMKVCMQIFQEGDLNWGRVVALFYFAYRLIVRALDSVFDSIPGARQMLSWVGDVLVRNIAHWVYSRGGWRMIKEWFGPSNKTMFWLCASFVVIGLLTYFKK